MSLMAEQVVEEWLNRQGFFTIRGARVGTGEIDLLAIRPSDEGTECWQYEVQGSLRPVSYICAAGASLQSEGRKPFNARKRSDDQMHEAVTEWVQKKFLADDKNRIRQSLCKGTWSFGLVLGNVKSDAEEQAIRSRDITILKLVDIIEQLEPKKRSKAGARLKLDAAGGNDLTELLWARQNLKKREPRED